MLVLAGISVDKFSYDFHDKKNLHESRCSSVLSPQSLSPSHVKLQGTQRPFVHAKSYIDEHGLMSTKQQNLQNVFRFSSLSKTNYPLHMVYAMVTYM